MTLFIYSQVIHFILFFWFIYRGIFPWYLRLCADIFVHPYVYLYPANFTVFLFQGKQIGCSLIVVKCTKMFYTTMDQLYTLRHTHYVH